MKYNKIYQILNHIKLKKIFGYMIESYIPSCKSMIIYHFSYYKFYTKINIFYWCFIKCFIIYIYKRIIIYAFYFYLL